MYIKEKVSKWGRPPWSQSLPLAFFPWQSLCSLAMRAPASSRLFLTSSWVYSILDSSIRISKVTPASAWTYCSVKFHKGSPEDVDFESEHGTHVTMSGHNTGLLCPQICNNEPAIISNICLRNWSYFLLLLRSVGSIAIASVLFLILERCHFFFFFIGPDKSFSIVLVLVKNLLFVSRIFVYYFSVFNFIYFSPIYFIIFSFCFLGWFCSPYLIYHGGELRLLVLHFSFSKPYPSRLCAWGIRRGWPMISGPCVLPAASGSAPRCLPLPPVRVLVCLFLVVFLGFRVVLNKESRTEESPSCLDHLGFGFESPFLPGPQTRAVTSRCSQRIWPRTPACAKAGNGSSAYLRLGAGAKWKRPPWPSGMPKTYLGFWVSGHCRPDPKGLMCGCRSLGPFLW